MRPTRTSTAAAAVAAAAFSLLLAASCASESWIDGRATFYGNGDGYSIHHGSCGFGTQAEPRIAAMPDTDPEFSSSCGACYEVACAQGAFTDGYGATVDHSGACKRGASVVVKITDSCPCDFPANYYSNKRWCCGDRRHLDLSYAAFAEIADTSKGVVAIKFRKVACGAAATGGPDAGGWQQQGGAPWATSTAASTDGSKGNPASGAAGGADKSKGGAQFGR